MAEIEMMDLNGRKENDGTRTVISPWARTIILIWLGITVISFGSRYCLFPFEDFLYLIPAMTYTTIFLGCIVPYLLWTPPQYIKYRLFGGEMQGLPKLKRVNLSKVAPVAGLIILERIIYRYSYSFALGLELTILKAALPFTYLLFSLGNTGGIFSFSLPMVGLLATIVALFSATPVSPQAFVSGIILNILLVSIALRTKDILVEISVFSFLYHISVILAPTFWLLVMIMGDTYWIHFYVIAAISQYTVGNGIIGAFQFTFGSILIRDTTPSHHIPVFALGSVIIDFLARFTLRQSLFSPTTLGLIVAGICCIVGLFRTVTPTKRSITVPKSAIIAIGATFLIHLLIFGIYFFVQDQHPIRVLIEQANLQFHDYTEAAKSPSLRDAVEEYNRRYGRPPPPGFDIWYQYALDHGSKVINEYDQIVEDLKPFWAIEPRVLRERIAHVAANEDNNIALIKVRERKAEIGISPQWKWMSEEIVKMVNTVGGWLPDMDFLFNTHDECRLLIPWAEKQKLLKQEELLRTKPVKEYVNWYPDVKWFPVKKTDSTDFETLSLQPVWDYVTMGCPPDSIARTPLLAGPHLQSISISRHTTASVLRSTRYVNSYKLAGDICSQPDLRFLSGFFMAPGAFQATHVPVPIFSQSRIEPFSDILAPSPWHHSGRSNYDEHKDHLWKEKQNVLFWRGANTNGISMNGGWRFHLRERFVRLAQHLRGKIDVGFTEIVRCRGWDCRAEKNTFKLKPSVDFDDFFQYKFLPDIDGAAFSGRWLSFLSSRGLPFKLAIFREWFDSRLIAWRHFIPLDLRLRERDFKSVMNWFMAEENDLWGKKVADSGREWAMGTLRNEDAVVYLFRLLLEYARVMHDERSHLGFVLPNAPEDNDDEIGR